MRAHRNHRDAAKMHGTTPGFTLVELVIVIIVAGILSTLFSRIIAKPFIGYQDLSRRGELVDAAELAVRRMARDVRSALPNSVRVAGGGSALEIIHAADGGRYRDDPGTNSGTSEDHTSATDWLSFVSGGDTEFNLLGRLGALTFSYGAPLSAGHRMAIYSTSSAVYSDAASGANPGSITPSATQITISDDVDEDHFLLSSAFEFALESPQQRVYIIDAPVTYLCDTSAETLTRYTGYTIASGQPTNPLVAPLSGASSAIVSEYVTGCTFSYTAGTPSRAALLIVEFTLSDSGESIELLRQVHVENTP